MTKVIFYMEKKPAGVFAYFPDLLFDNQGNRFSYAKVGQHSACHEHYAKRCEMAKYDQYVSLLTELTGIYDDLKVLNPDFKKSYDYQKFQRAYYGCRTEKGRKGVVNRAKKNLSPYDFRRFVVWMQQFIVKHGQSDSN